MRTIAEEFSKIDIGQPSHFRNLTLFPLLRKTSESHKFEYLLLEDAIRQGIGRITELQHGASVPEISFENTGELPVVLIDGEELVGAKQNRVLNLTILAPQKQTTIIPVSCVEAGRWNMTTSDFKPVDRVMYSGLRGVRVSQVTHSMRSRNSRRSDQSSVWDAIASKASRLGASSPTQAMSAIYERHANSLEEYVRAFDWHRGESGIAALIGERVLGIDLFDREETMERFFKKLVRSFALDALDIPQSSGAASLKHLQGFLGKLSSAPSFAQPAVGIGKDVRCLTPELSAAGLWANEAYVHLCVFSRPGSNDFEGLETRISRPTQRRAD